MFVLLFVLDPLLNTRDDVGVVEEEEEGEDAAAEVFDPVRARLDGVEECGCEESFVATAVVAEEDGVRGCLEAEEEEGEGTAAAVGEEERRRVEAEDVVRALFGVTECVFSTCVDGSASSSSSSFASASFSPFSACVVFVFLVAEEFLLRLPERDAEGEEEGGEGEGSMSITMGEVG